MHVYVQQLGNSGGGSPAPYFISPKQWLRATFSVVSSGDTERGLLRLSTERW